MLKVYQQHSRMTQMASIHLVPDSAILKFLEVHPLLLCRRHVAHFWRRAKFSLGVVSSATWAIQLDLVARQRMKHVFHITVKFASHMRLASQLPCRPFSMTNIVSLVAEKLTAVVEMEPTKISEGLEYLSLLQLAPYFRGKAENELYKFEYS